MNMKKHFLHFVLALMFILTPLCIFADVDVSDMSNWDDDDWSEFLDGIQETPDGWDGTPATYGEDIHDCAVYDGSDGTSHDPTTTYITDADGNLVTLTYSDVYDENGNFIYSYEGKETDPDAKADIEARIAEFFESMKTEKIEEALSDILSRYFDAAKELEEALSDRKSVTEACKEKNIDLYILATHVVFMGKTAVQSAIKFGVGENSPICNDWNLFSEAFLPTDPQDFVDSDWKPSKLKNKTENVDSSNF